MDNFEARYRAIVEKEPQAAFPRVGFTYVLTNDDRDWYQVSNGMLLDNHIARAAVCWWLERKAIEHFGGPQEYWKFIVEVIGWGCYETDPQDVVLTVHEITLGIKEKA